ncbi:MAG: hypothetical protein NZT92_19715 [Abditibacteriales bacterium]|nr:hypothetical protein [Abditibacteriales bacterium]MDW8367928.1 hypothetical protein [Abditibacteriales bacterium]
MDRRKFLEWLAGSVASMTTQTSNVRAQQSALPFRARGVYFHDGFTVEPKSHAPLYWDYATWRRAIQWLHACGLNVIEFATMLEFNRVPSTAMEKQKIADRLKILDYAHALGMEFGYILSNTVLSTVPPDEEPSHQLKNRAVTLCPRAPGNFEKTVAIPLFYMETYKEADFFEEFAADWGGCTCGQCGVADFLRYVRVLAERLKQLNPPATLYANTWCISYWGKEPLAHGWKGVFEKEIVGSREVITALPRLPDNVGVALPCHHLYRPLVFAENGGKSKTPVFPTADDVQQIRRAGRNVLAWPHFIMDDDPSRPPAWGIVHSEVRYLQALLQALQKTGIDRVMGNLYLPFLQLSNTFAWGRLCENPQRKPQDVIQEFARLIAHRDDAERLAEILTWVENNSYWQQQIPPDGRLPNLPCALNRATAAKQVERIRPNPSPSLPLPVSAEMWLYDLRRSIERMTWAA